MLGHWPQVVHLVGGGKVPDIISRPCDLQAALTGHLALSGGFQLPPPVLGGKLSDTCLDHI
jgi:hypothetical protein